MDTGIAVKPERRVRCELLGTTVTLPAKPERIACFVPGLTECIWAMGLQERVVATSTYCRRYVNTGNRPTPGDYLKINEAELRALEPDLVIMTGGIQHGVSRRLAREGLPIYELPLADSFYGILENIRRLGALLGEMSRAIELTDRMEAEAAALRAQAPAKRPRVYVELWCGRFPRKVGGLSYVRDMVAIAGGEPVCSYEPTGYMSLDTAWVEQAKPDTLLIFWEEDDTVVDVAKVLAERGWTGQWEFRVIEAGIEPGKNLIHDGPSYLDTARWLAGQLKRFGN